MEPLNPPPSPTSIANRRIRLQSGSEKFCEILLHKEALQVIIVQGDLVDGQKVHPTFVKNAYDCSSYGRIDILRFCSYTVDVANEYILELVNDKLDEGFDLVLDEELDNQDRVNEDKDDESSLSFKDMQDFLHHVEVEGLELDNGKENKVVMTKCVKQDSSEVEDVEKEGKISPIQNIQENRKIREEEEEKKLEKDNSRGPLVEKELTLSGHMKAYANIVEEQAERLHLIYENFGNKMFIAGQQEHVLEFLAWLYEQTIETLEEQILVLKESKLKQKNNDYQQIEVTFSTFHRMHQDEIFKKANELELICDFAYDVVLVSGFLENLKEFKAFLQEVEASAKKSLYPKYWDFHVVEKFSEIDVLEGTNEFLEVEDLFMKSLNNMRITRLTRIQNKYLMDHFITMLQKRQEFRDEVNTTRKLLFHGSRQVHPQTIYKDSDIGFDLQYSNSGGSYGKGLYFAVNSNYSHTYAYNLNNGSFQMFLADVFIGKSTRNGGSGLLKAPAGYDSVESANSFYIVYNNFHSYPLYLIEYTANNNPPDVYLNQPIVNANVVVNNNNNVIGGGGVPANVLQPVRNNFSVKPIPQRNIKPLPILKPVPKSTTKIQNFFGSKGMNESEKKYQ